MRATRPRFPARTGHGVRCVEGASGWDGRVPGVGLATDPVFSKCPPTAPGLCLTADGALVMTLLRGHAPTWILRITLPSVREK